MKALVQGLNRALLILALAAAVAVVRSECNRRAMPWRNAGGVKGHAGLAERPLPFPVPEYFRRWRAAFIEINRPQDRHGLVRGIFLGESSAVDAPTRELFLDAGLSHLLSANGLKCWIVALTFKLGLALLLHLSAPNLPAALVLRSRRGLGPLARFCGTWLFWLWSSQTPAITRVAVLFTTKIVLDALELRVAFFRLLVVQYLCSLALAPALWHSAGFQLTYGCLTGILWFPRLVRRWRPQQGGLRTALWDYFAVSTGAVVGGLPCSLLIFDEINFMSLTTNWFAVPLVSFVIMPLGLTQMLLLAPGLGLENFAWSRTAIDALGAAAAAAASMERTGLSTWLKYIPALRWP